MSEARNPHQALPLAGVTGIWSDPDSIYPDVIRVAMSNGKVVDYRIDVQQPHPAFKRVMGLLEKIPYGASEHGYKAKHAKK